MIYRVRRVTRKGIETLADYDGQDYLWSLDEDDMLIFEKPEQVFKAADCLPGHVRVEGKTKAGWKTDFNASLKNKHQ